MLHITYYMLRVTCTCYMSRVTCTCLAKQMFRQYYILKFKLISNTYEIDVRTTNHNAEINGIVFRVLNKMAFEKDVLRACMRACACL